MKITLLKIKLLLSLGCLTFFTSQLIAECRRCFVEHADIWKGVAYNPNSSFQYDLSKTVLNSFTFKGTEHVLNLNLGNNSMTALITAKVPHGSVVDANDENITYENKFDVVISLCALHKVSDLHKMLSNIYKALKPGGKTLLFFPVLGDHSWQAELAATIGQKKTWLDIFLTKNRPFDIDHQITSRDLARINMNTGFATSSVDVRDLRYMFPSMDSFKTWFTTLSWFKIVPVEQQETFLNDFIEHVLPCHQSTNSTFSLRQGYALALATKADDEQPLTTALLGGNKMQQTLLDELTVDMTTE